MFDLHGDVPKGTEPSRIQPQAHQERVTLHLQLDVAPEFSAKNLLESHSSGEITLPWIAFREAAAVPGLDSEVERRASVRYREPEKSTSKYEQEIEVMFEVHIASCRRIPTTGGGAVVWKPIILSIMGSSATGIMKTHQETKPPISPRLSSGEETGVEAKSPGGDLGVEFHIILLLAQSHRHRHDPETSGCRKLRA